MISQALLFHFAFFFGTYTATPAHIYTCLTHLHTIISMCARTHSSICMLTSAHTCVQTHSHVHTHMLSHSHLYISIPTYRASIGQISHGQPFPLVKKFLAQKHTHKLKLFAIVNAIQLHLGKLEFD